MINVKWYVGANNNYNSIIPNVISTDLYGYSPYFETLNLPASVELSNYLSGSHPEAVWQPYSFSWRLGVRDNPGSQGYHGLKGVTDDRFIILDHGGHQLFRTYVFAPENKTYRIEKEGVDPNYIHIDGQLANNDRVYLTKGWHSLLIAYANTTKGEYILKEKQSYSIDDRNRSAIVFYPEAHPPIKKTTPYDSIVAMKWFNTSHLAYNPFAGQDKVWQYQFSTAPGTCEMELDIKGELLQLWVDGREIKKKQWTNKTGTGKYQISLKEFHTGVSTVCLTAKPMMGYHGPALFTVPVKLTCKNGQIPEGDWSQFGALKFYSGGMRYKKNVFIDKMKEEGQRIALDLGMVDATCEIWINGQFADILMNPPYRLDITNLL